MAARCARVPAGALSGLEYEAVSCTACGTLYQTLVGNEQLLGDLYGKWLAANNEKYVEFEWLADHPRPSRDGHELMTAAAILHTSPDRLKTLGYGMGEGLWARIAARMGCES